ncbi:hypothetical protein [Bacillus sp. T33-2]|uniref:hypothetical protein n=1 Tax=Bacillus sp. T33-2 TaxID=2054168 RepID=UPI00115BF4A3|nr:hypothetical protein [Bacillus sp. T33-2]
MSELDGLVKGLMERIDQEYEKVASLQSEYRSLYDQQAQELEQAAQRLLPVMTYIKNNGYRFNDKLSNTFSNMGPVFRYEPGTNTLFIYHIDHQTPAAINLTNQQVTLFSYLDLLGVVDFETAMKSLLLTLTYHEELQKDYQEGIDRLESQLKQFPGNIV